MISIAEKCLLLWPISIVSGAFERTGRGTKGRGGGGRWVGATAWMARWIMRCITAVFSTQTTPWSIPNFQESTKCVWPHLIWVLSINLIWSYVQLLISGAVYLLQLCARSEYHTQLAKMSFDEIFDLTAGVYFNFFNLLQLRPQLI